MHPIVESAEEELLHNVDPLESTSLDVEFPSSPVTPTMVTANPSIVRDEVLEDVIPLEVTPLRSNLELLTTTSVSLMEKYARVAVKTALRAAFLAINPCCSSPSEKGQGCDF